MRDPLLVIDRTVDLEVAPDELWRLISTADGWRSWLVDEAQLERDGVGALVGGAVTDHDVVKLVRVDEIREGRSIAFTWWNPHPSDRVPAGVSKVGLEIVDNGDGTSRLQITEQLRSAPGVVTQTTRNAWEVRVCSLWACTVAAALV